MLTEGFARKPAVWVLGNYPPRRCGIATFTSDLADAVESNGTPCRVAAMDDGSGLIYPERAEIVIGQDDLAAYIEAADKMNGSRASAVFIQHEFGIFGGEAGSHIVTLLRFLELPVVTTMHTVLDRPSDSQRWITEEILSKSERVVVMSRKAKEILRRSYGRDDNVVVIPHGTPSPLALGRSTAKRELGWEGRKTIFTFGLLSPDKGIETMVRAMAAIKEQHPDALYVVAGQTHPHIKKAFGEGYRESLETLRDSLGLQDSVVFVNRFTELDELIMMLTACDLYVTPYLKLEQITSGTLSYAVGLGRCVVSTPYWHAEELLSQGPGRLVPPGDVEGFASTISELLGDDEARHMHEAEARRIGQAVRWPRIGSEYLRLVADIWKPIHLPAASTSPSLRIDRAPRSITSHLQTLTDDTGLFQHATYDVPNRFEGYCLDDNVRALGVLWDAPKGVFDPETFDRLERLYLSFVHHAWNPESGAFRNFMSYGRQWLEAAGSDDCQARTFATLAKGAQVASREERRLLCRSLFTEAWPAVARLEFPRYSAQMLKAAAQWLAHSIRPEKTASIAELFARELESRLDANGTSEWYWFEPQLTYDNARIPEGLLAWAMYTGDESLQKKALNSLRWLCGIQQKDGYFCPIGNQGFWYRDGKRPYFDQQPLEAWATADACRTALSLTGERTWLGRAELALNWFYGRNALGALMVDPESGACSDGLERHGPNGNRGAESCLAFLGATFAVENLNALAEGPHGKAAVL